MTSSLVRFTVALARTLRPTSARSLRSRMIAHLSSARATHLPSAAVCEQDVTHRARLDNHAKSILHSKSELIVVGGRSVIEIGKQPLKS